MNGEPTKEDQKTQQLHALHHATGQLIALKSAAAAPRILIDGDIEVAWPQEVKDQIAERIKTKLSKAAGLIKELQNDD